MLLHDQKRWINTYFILNLLFLKIADSPMQPTVLAWASPHVIFD